ncbi:efflux RND transporter periplasmic adaptor subunit [Cohnella panacarvi]|uniref:efflux RND transporter periplasmic adaptor subunit n=1 Tax=Cohnella panacarvi TaxID=400776 RepID=UPI00047BEADF|nr:hypothetical protein [Cohnella panacarvi]
MEGRTSGFSQRQLRLISGLFLALLAACTLAGNTIRGMSLPKVYTQLASQGSITHEYEGSATVQPVRTRDIHNPAGWKVNQVFVKTGDKVDNGQKLIAYDNGEAKLQLEDMLNNLKKQQLSYSQLQTDYKVAATEGDEGKLAAAKIALDSAKLDLASQKNHIQSLQKSIAEGQSVLAPFAGIVVQVNALAGSGPGGLPDVVLTDSSKGYQIQLQVPGDVAGMLEIGEELNQISLTGKESRQLTGTIEAVDDGMPGAPEGNPSGLNASAIQPSSVKIRLEDDQLIGGERVRVKIAKSSKEQTVIVPKEAVHQDGRGTYVFTLESREGALGNAFYAVETPIKIADSNSYVVSVAEGLFGQQEVILNSTGFLMDGMRVRR